MQREIAYRAWHKQKKIMCDVLLICFVNRYVDVLPEDQLEGGTQEEWKFEEIELMQFTGLLDKEGNKIFEDDVLRSVHFKEGNKTHYLYHIVKWDNRLSGWIAQNIDAHNGNFTDQGNPQIWVYIKNVDFDIMGPIHDHPHLLNKTSNQQQ